MRLVSDEGVKEVDVKEESPEEESATKEISKTPIKKPIKGIQKELTEKEIPTGEEIQLVVFKLGQEEYGVEIHEVETIIKMSEITRVPHAPEFVEGIINLRGKIVVVINLLKRFGTFKEDEHKGTHMIISEVEGNMFGIMVDGVSEVLKIGKKDTRKAPGIIASKIHAEYLKGIGILDGGERLLILIDLDKILGEKEMLEMAKLTEGMRDRAKEMEKKKIKKTEKPKITDEEIAEEFEDFGKTKDLKKINKIPIEKETEKTIDEEKEKTKTEKKSVMKKKIEEEKIPSKKTEETSQSGDELDKRLEKEKKLLEKDLERKFEKGGKV